MVIRGFVFKGGVKGVSRIEILKLVAHSPAQLSGEAENILYGMEFRQNGRAKLVMDIFFHQDMDAFPDLIQWGDDTDALRISEPVERGLDIHGHIVHQTFINKPFQHLRIRAIGIELGFKALIFEKGKNLRKTGMKGRLPSSYTDTIHPAPKLLEALQYG